MRVTGTPERGALLAKALELVKLGRETGHSRYELLAIIIQEAAIRPAGHRHTALHQAIRETCGSHCCGGSV
ncbi:MAG TPA: hypothetical protein VHT27_02600 [Solirubrobacteraceae bacterium]|nr:hypothetical protein [Solirubrobacteraceae bacterium]